MMKPGPTFEFTFRKLEDEYRLCIDQGYTVMPCYEYIQWKKEGSKGKALVNRVDVDFNIKKVSRLADIFARLNVRATFFIRLHAPEYNPFSFEAYRIIKRLISDGHEIGYHSEVIDQSHIWNEDATNCFIRDIDVMNKMFDIQVKGSASHGGLTGYNNLDFWQDKKAADFGLLYEAYDHQPEFNLFQESRYVSDSEWTQWKAYHNGKLLKDDRRAPSLHAMEAPQVLHILIHPDTYFDHHFYE
jgi:hypothetical protein